eukprot:TRINITY_DN1249_c0_g1_i2.p1 TRINITY_DN1249_c0_g1~~TRINITY_DN1249_c0_g1_i2.p1  ORF type:complete len:635 (+),score=225.54 TRINITY_DN1249_c0_g1_i2:60-1964(+)
MDFEESKEEQAEHEEAFGSQAFAESGENSEQNDGVIFVLDCAKSMQQLIPRSEGAKSNIEEVLSAACSFMRTKIISSNKDRVGIILYSCGKSRNALGFPGISVLRRLELLDAASIKELDRLAEDPELFHALYCAGQSLDSLLCDVLSVAQNLFQDIDKPNYSKRIFLFTNNDNPDSGSKDLQAKAIQRAKDLYEQHAEIELFPMQGTDRFDIMKFFGDLITIDPDQLGVLASTEATEERFQELTKRIRQKEYIKRSLGKVRFQLGPGMEIAVKIYNVVQEVKRPLAKSLQAGTNKLLKSVTRKICEETGAVLYDNQIGTYYPYGGEKVVITKEETKEIKKFDVPGMKLMGFKARSRLKDYMNIRSSYFVSADDQTISNSSQVIDALVREMIEKDKMAVVRLIAKETSVLRFCALLPQLESVDPEDNFRHPQGFNMIFLPYADDIRSPESIIKRDRPPKVNEEQVSAAKLLIKNLSIDFDSRQFENPAIQKFYATVQALALNEREPEPIADIMQPDYEGMAKFSAIIEQFKQVTYGDSYNHARQHNDRGGGQGKRQRKGGEKKKKSEEEKGEEMDDVMNERLGEENEELRNKFEDGSIRSCTVDQLKEMLQSRRIKIGKASKEDLLDKLRGYLQV